MAASISSLRQKWRTAKQQYGYYAGAFYRSDGPAAGFYSQSQNENADYLWQCLGDRRQSLGPKLDAVERATRAHDLNALMRSASEATAACQYYRAIAEQWQKKAPWAQLGPSLGNVGRACQKLVATLKELEEAIRAAVVVENW